MFSKRLQKLTAQISALKYFDPTEIPASGKLSSMSSDNAGTARRTLRLIDAPGKISSRRGLSDSWWQEEPESDLQWFHIVADCLMILY
jgi:hypothetical protein